MTPKVFVIDQEGKPCLPTHPARARKLLREGKAKVYQVVPFTIQLERVIENPVGSFTIGIDDGAKEVGIAVVNEVTKEVVFRGAIQLRGDVKRKILQRAGYRRTRRCRQLRHRKARFLNRKQKMPQPSIRQRKESILRVVNDLARVLNLTDAVIEQGQFDVSSLAAGRQLVGIEFQQSDYEGEDFRAKVLWRDGYTCQCCGGKEKLTAHHIIPRHLGGTSTPKNGFTLCRMCHESLHKGEWILNKKPAIFKYPMYLMQGKHYLVKILSEIGLEISTCVGWMTARWRKRIGIEKSHSNDALTMVTRNYIPRVASLEYQIIPKRAQVWEGNPTKKNDEKLGFRHFDLVKVHHRTKGWVVGSVRSLKARVMTLRTKFDANFSVSYRKSTVLYRFNRIVYIY
ncbi:HNH endonuclease [Candidatus Poribacteria bacterium]|nr:HNH endonuclease [Candidatus Poribacteria bacterium]